LFFYFYPAIIFPVRLKDIYIRTITGVFFLIAIIGSIILHPLVFFSLIFIFTLLGLNEFFILSGSNNGRKNNIHFYFFGMLIYVVTGLIGLGYIDFRFGLLLLLLFPLTIVVELFRKKGASWLRIGTYFTAFLYIAVPFGLMNSLFYIPDVEGSYTGILIGLFVLIWSNDVFAYLIGSLFGKHRLFAGVSPKKSWEGSIAGLAFALIAAYVLSLFFTEISLINWLTLTLIIVITGTLGDLSASLLKRIAGVKDSGTIFPGHGGVLDRFDATIFAILFVFVYLNLF
jgi:phosphatidate cytidylyltransferase